MINLIFNVMPFGAPTASVSVDGHAVQGRDPQLRQHLLRVRVLGHVDGLVARGGRRQHIAVARLELNLQVDRPVGDGGTLSTNKGCTEWVAHAQANPSRRELQDERALLIGKLLHRLPEHGLDFGRTEPNVLSVIPQQSSMGA